MNLAHQIDHDELTQKYLFAAPCMKALITSAYWTDEYTSLMPSGEPPQTGKEAYPQYLLRIC